MTTIAIAGGTGVVGRRVVESVRRLGVEPVVIARSTGVDVTTGTGLDDVLAGVDAVIDVTKIVTPNRRRRHHLFETATAICSTPRSARVSTTCAVDRRHRHRRPGLLPGQAAQEDLVRRGPVPWIILRATEFREFAAQMPGDGPSQSSPRCSASRWPRRTSRTSWSASQRLRPPAWRQNSPVPGRSESGHGTPPGLRPGPSASRGDPAVARSHREWHAQRRQAAHQSRATGTSDVRTVAAGQDCPRIWDSSRGPMTHETTVRELTIDAVDPS